MGLAIYICYYSYYWWEVGDMILSAMCSLF